VGVLSYVSTYEKCLATAERLVGQSLTKIVYVRLWYEGRADFRYDYGDWHWPEVGVEVTTDQGLPFHAIWSSEVASFDMTLAVGPISDHWRPLREVPEGLHVLDVSNDGRWRPFLNRPLQDVAITTWEVGGFRGPVGVPIAVRLSVPGHSAWIVEAQPKNAMVTALEQDNFYLGMDEVIVIFGDTGAQSIGL
jgi:hypothetical protein